MVNDTYRYKNHINADSKIRVRVEHIFGFMTNSMNDALYMKYISIKRVKDSIGLLKPNLQPI